LVERDDFSSGTSSKSTKLVHGGVRYLEKAVWNLDFNQYKLVKEALRERRFFLTCAGGKWTTYRQMAEDAVDKAIDVFKLKPGKVAHVPDISGLGSFNDAAIFEGSCQTHRVRLIGAHGYSKTLFINLIQHFGLNADVAKHLAQSYGDRTWDVATLASSATNSTNYPFRGRKISPIYP
jgi:glycerol-3-phosphate dehydrogenase